MKRSLTGIKPTGIPHLGNYVGAIRPSIQSKGHQGHYFIADYHALTTVHDPKVMRQNIIEVAATWMACGLDLEQNALYLQSHIPEILELNWILACFTSKGLMNRAHAYKALVQNNEGHQRDPDQGVNLGIYAYPVLMAADILMFEADLVPVGQDQLQHIEIARDIAESFNHNYGDLLKLPQAQVQENQKSIPGLDGRKMSKSYDNTIPLFCSEKKLKKMINKIATDSLPPEAPKDPSASHLFEMYQAFASEEQSLALKELYQKGIGWGEVKAQLFELVNNEIKESRATYEDLVANPEKVEAELARGQEKVRPKAQAYLKRLKQALGLS